MPGFNPENINIHDLTIEEPEKKAEPLFDPEKEITDKDWDMIMGGLKERRDLKHTPEFFAGAAKIKILHPDTDFNITVKEDERMRGLLRSWQAKNKWQDFVNGAMSMKILDPKTEFWLTGEDWQKIEGELEEIRKTVVVRSGYAADVKIIDPDKNLFNQDDWENTEDALEIFRRNENGWAFATTAMDARILDSDTKLNIKGADWQIMRHALDGFRQEGNWKRFLSLATGMKILAAEKVELTKGGIEVTMPKDKTLVTDTPPMPEVKSF